MIVVSDVKKEYNKRTVLDIRELIFKQGKRYALLGTNGSGKSTLLKIIAGTETPEQGKVESDIIGKKAVGYLPQTPYGFSFSVLKNVLIAIDEGADRQERAEAAIEAVGMSALIKANGSKLSGGETQRIAFARMIAIPRKLLLLDEPTAAADLKGIDLLEGALLKYCAETRCTVVFASHSPAQALRLADEIVFLHEGTVAEQGGANQVINNPQSEEARAFLKHWKV